MRCLTLADVLAESGARCRFITRAHDGHLASVLERRGFTADVLPLRRPPRDHSEPGYADWLGADWQTDAADTIAAMSGAKPDWLVVDHYAIDRRWEAALRPHCGRILVVDDLANREHECDLLLDQNVMAEAESRYDGLVPASCGRMIGPRHALLHPAYASLRSSVMVRQGPIRRVMLFFGGSDLPNLTAKALAAIVPLLDGTFHLDVVITATSPHAADIRRMVDGLTDITLHESLPTLAPLIASADLALGAGGATSLERCCLGLPSIIVTLAENQRPGAAELHRQGLVEWLGDDGEVSVEAITSATASALKQGCDTAMSARCLALLDGRGAATVAGWLMLGPSTPLRARLATAADEALLLEWANDPDVRANSFTPDRIDAVSHGDWFRRKLAAPDDCRLYVIETAAGIPIGPVRFDRDGDDWVITFSLDARARGRGLGRPMLAAAIDAFPATGNRRLLAKVKTSNHASRRVFEELGFSLVASTPHLEFATTWNGPRPSLLLAISDHTVGSP
jgi:UDP-2,4-diacetamido-2,4,6-trideoxy-beta-L-altropyranose hydrolase